MATVTEKVKEKVLGVDVEPQLSEQTRDNFLQYAKKDEASGEYYMTEVEFVDAIAPEGEDYVSVRRRQRHCARRPSRLLHSPY